MELGLGQRSVIWLIPYQNISYQVRTIEYVVKGEKFVNSYHEESEKVKMNDSWWKCMTVKRKRVLQLSSTIMRRLTRVLYLLENRPLYVKKAPDCYPSLWILVPRGPLSRTH